jgi:hypothetical protein
MVQSLNRRQDLLNSSAHGGDNSNNNGNGSEKGNNGGEINSSGGLVSMDLSSVGLGAGQCSSGVSALASALAGRRLGNLQHLALDGNQLAAHDGALLGDAIARSYRSAHTAHVRETKGDGTGSNGSSALGSSGNDRASANGSANQGAVGRQHVEASKVDNDDTGGSVLWYAWLLCDCCARFTDCCARFIKQS